MALTEKPADHSAEAVAAAAKRDEAAAAKRIADDTRTAEERTADLNAAAARQLDLQQIVAQRADALERGDDQALHDADQKLSGFVSDKK